MHRIDLATGKEVLDTENPGNVVGWTTDLDFVRPGGHDHEPRRILHTHGP